MSANRLFLVCSHHQNIEDSICIGERLANDTPYASPNLKRLAEWYAKHMACGRGMDHFQLAYNRPQDWDVPQPAEHTPAGAVRLALVQGSH